MELGRPPSYRSSGAHWRPSTSIARILLARFASTTLAWSADVLLARRPGMPTACSLSAAGSCLTRGFSRRRRSERTWSTGAASRTGSRSMTCRGLPLSGATRPGDDDDAAAAAADPHETDDGGLLVVGAWRPRPSRRRRPWPVLPWRAGGDQEADPASERQWSGASGRDGPTGLSGRLRLRHEGRRASLRIRPVRGGMARAEGRHLRSGARGAVAGRPWSSWRYLGLLVCPDSARCSLGAGQASTR
jgi:hypothetical protein